MAENQDIYAPNVEPSTQAPNDVERIQANPAAFGAPVATGLEKLGAGITQVGNFWGQIQTDHALNGALSQANDQVDAFKKLNGQDALNAQASMKQQLEDSFAQAGKSLPSAQQRLQFDNASRAYLDRQLLRAVNDHADQQGRAFAINTATDTYNLAVGRAASTADDPNEIEGAIGDATRAQIQLQQSRYGVNLTDDQKAFAEQKAAQDVYSTQIGALAAHGKAAQAQQLLEQHRADLGIEYPRLAQGIKARADLDMGTQAARRAIADAGQGFLQGQSPQQIPNAASPFPAPITRAQFAGSPQLNILADTISVPESGGRYDVRYNGQPGGAPIADLSRHPGIAEPISAGPEAGKTSTAAGRYQFLKSTYDPIAQQLGLTDFSPKSQDQAFGTLASQVYNQKTGRNLQADLSAGKTDQLVDALHSTWPSINQNSVSRLNAELQNVSSGGGNLPSASFKASAYDRLLQDPALQDNPEAFRHAVAQVNEQANAASVAAMADQQARRERSEAAGNGIVTDALNGRSEGLIGRIANNPDLTYEEKLHLSSSVESMFAKVTGRDTQTYGPAFWDTYQRIHLPDGDPNKITAMGDLYAKGPSGDLTIAGIKELQGELTLKKTPDGEAESAMRATFLRNARAQISGSAEHLGFADPKGDEQYLKFQAQFFPAYEKARQAGATPESLLNPDSKDYLGKSIAGFKRPEEQVQRDLQAAFASANSNKPPLDLNKADDVVAAFHSGNITYADAAQRLRGFGYRDDVSSDLPPLPVAR